MTQSFEFYSRKGLFSNRLLQAHVRTSEVENNKNGEGMASFLKSYSIDAGYIFSERKPNSLAKGFLNNLRRIGIICSNVPKLKPSIHT